MKLYPFCSALIVIALSTFNTSFAGTSGGIVVPDTSIALSLESSAYQTIDANGDEIFYSQEPIPLPLISTLFEAAGVIKASILYGQGIPWKSTEGEFIHQAPNVSFLEIKRLATELSAKTLSIHLPSTNQSFDLEDLELIQTSNKISGIDQFGNTHWIVNSHGFDPGSK